MAATRVWPENDAAADRPSSVRRAWKKPEEDVASGVVGAGVVEEAGLGARVEDPNVDFPDAGEPASLTVPDFPTNAHVVRENFRTILGRSLPQDISSGRNGTGGSCEVLYFLVHFFWFCERLSV